MLRREFIDCGHGVPRWRWVSTGQHRGFCADCQAVKVIWKPPKKRPLWRRIKLVIENN